jgi:phosphatidylinositol glycan class B
MNLVQGKAAAYGTEPWWKVIVYASTILIPPFSLAILIVLTIGSWYGRRDVVVWSAVPFLFVHVVLARKDARFLIPLLYLLGPWFAVSVDALPSAIAATLDRWQRTRVARAGSLAFCAVNLGALSVAIVLPGNDRIRLDEWLWHQSRQHPITLYEIHHRESGLPINVTNSFYAANTVVKPFTAGTAIGHAQAEPDVLIYYEGSSTLSTVPRECRLVVRSYPVWLTQLPLFARATNITSASICRHPLSQESG